MLKWFERACLLLVVIFQVGWLVTLRFNSHLDPCRFAERQKASIEFGQAQTPESQAAWDQEWRLLAEHQVTKTLLVVVVFLVMDGIAIYYLWKSGRGKKEPAQSTPSVPA